MSEPTSTPVTSAAAAPAAPVGLAALGRELQNYKLPEQSIAVSPIGDQPIQHAIDFAFHVAQAQGLVADERETDQGILFVGRLENGRQMILGFQYYLLSDGRVVFTYIMHSTGLDTTACSRMCQKYLSALASGKPAASYPRCRGVDDYLCIVGCRCTRRARRPRGSPWLLCPGQGLVLNCLPSLGTTA